MRWALAYLAGAWVVLQVIGVLSQGFDWAVVVLRVATVVLAAGFFAAVIVAWHHGEKGRQSVTRTELLLLALVALIVIAAVAWVEGPGRRDGGDPSVFASVGAPARVQLAANRVAVIPFENRTGDAALDPLGSMAADWAIQGLTHTGLANVVPVTTTLTAPRFVAREGGDADGPDRIRSLAEETGAGIVVSGAYYRQRDSLYVRVTVTDAVAMQVLYALEPIAAPTEDPLAAVDLLRHQLMRILAPHIDPRTRGHEARPDFVPPSFEAYKAFADALELFIARDWRAAIPGFLVAATEDSSFTTPLVYAGISHGNVGNFAAAVPRLAPSRALDCRASYAACGTQRMRERH